jgi:GrpB-like predicted nucleotidyltransferase (UPF0157 family)
MLGLDSNQVLLAEYDQDWVSYYESEANVIKNALGNLVIDIQHIGSTSVPGLKAKPIIDILAGLKSFEQIDTVIKQMEALEYTYAHWAGIPGDYTFRKGNFTTHFVHIVIHGGQNWNHNIRFRDIVRNNPNLAREYELLKEELVKQYPDSREKYTEGKSKFIFNAVQSIGI